MARISINGSVAATDKCLRRIPRHKVVAPAITRVTVFFQRQAVSLFQSSATFPCPYRSIQFLRKQADGPWYTFLLDGELRNWVKQQRYFLAAFALYAGLFLLCRGWILSPAAGIGHGYFDSSDQLLLLPPHAEACPQAPAPSQTTPPATPDIQVRVQADLKTIKPLDPMANTLVSRPAISLPALRLTMRPGSALSLLRGHGKPGGRRSGSGGGGGKLKVISGQACGNAVGAGGISSIPRDFVFTLVASKCEVRRVELILNLQAYIVPDQFEIIYRDRVVWRIDLPGDLIGGLNLENFVKYWKDGVTYRIILNEEGKVIKRSIMGNFKTTSSGKSNITSGSSGSDGDVLCITRWARGHASPKGKFLGWVNHYYDFFGDPARYDPARQVILRVHSSNKRTEWNLAADISFYVE